MFCLIRKFPSAIAEVALRFNIPKKLRKLSCASENKRKNYNCASCSALLLVEKIIAFCCAALLVKCYSWPPLIMLHNYHYYIIIYQ